MVSRHVTHDMRKIRPASAMRVEQAANQIIHFVIHSDGRLGKRAGQWRIARALAAAGAARRALERLHRVQAHRVQVSACLEIIERLINELQLELAPQ